MPRSKVHPGQCLTLKVTEVPRYIEVALLIDIERKFGLMRNGTGADRIGLRIPAFFWLANRSTTPRMAATLSWARSRMRVGVV
jgi:hypothetical protein